MADPDTSSAPPAAVVVPADDRVAERAGEPPVVARLVIEIRSDGTRTIARGALEDAALGQKVAIRAEGTTPLALAASLVGALFRAPLLGSVLSRALKPSPRKRPGR
jgi:hypothetical protein